MSHLIEDDRRFWEIAGSIGGRAWHMLGTVTDAAQRGKIKVVEAFKLGGLLYENDTYPVFYQRPDGTMVATDKFVIVRPGHTFDGTEHPEKLLSAQLVSGGYQTIRNEDIATALEPLNAKWPIDACGVLREGKQVFATFDAGRFAIKGTDEHQMFFVAIETKDGTGAMKIILTPVRAVCNNTVTMGLEVAEWDANIRHDATAYRDLDFWANVAPQLAEKSIGVQQTLQDLADHMASDAAFLKIMRAAFPNPKPGKKMSAANLTDLKLTDADVAAIAEEQKTYEADMVKRRGQHALCVETYDIFNQRNAKTARTLYAAAQSVNEVAMWIPGKGTGLYQTQINGWRADASKAAFKTAVGIMERGDGGRN